MKPSPQYKWYITVYPDQYRAISLLPGESPDEVGHNTGALAMIGPFRTRRAALWAEKYGRSNPHFQHVNDAERLSKEVR